MKQNGETIRTLSVDTKSAHWFICNSQDKYFVFVIVIKWRIEPWITYPWPFWNRTALGSPFRGWKFKQVSLFQSAMAWSIWVLSAEAKRNHNHVKTTKFASNANKQICLWASMTNIQDQEEWWVCHHSILGYLLFFAYAIELYRLVWLKIIFNGMLKIIYSHKYNVHMCTKRKRKS